MLPTVRALRERLIPWYVEHRRDLPWRRTRDPYALVVAEMMLQQTGVDRVAARWPAFLTRFPSWRALADAPIGDAIVEWRGLGYNRRAVALHRVARTVVDQHGGQLPANRDHLLELPGVGPYTTNAILSFVHGQDVAAIDVNLRRVIGRVVFGRDDASLAEISRAADEALPPGQSAEWNQALMDFASLQCTLKRPVCLFCPLGDVCAGAGVENRAAPRTMAAERAHAYIATPFVGSRRHLRGRIVDAARQLPAGGTLSLAEVEALVAAAGATDGVDAADLLAGLLDDGLLTQVAEGYRLP